MEQELRQIALDLRDWAKKYGKSFASICAIKDTTHASVGSEDKDYKKLDMFIKEEEINDNQLKQELDDMRHKYDDLKEDYKEMSQLKEIFGNTIIEIGNAVLKYRGCNPVNIEKEINKILADLSVELVSSK